MIQNILYFNRTFLCRIKPVFIAVIFINYIVNIVHAQDLKSDTLVQTSEDISIIDTIQNNTAFITIKDNTMIYVTKGTKIKNFIVNTDNRKNIVFIDNNQTKEDKKSIKDINTEVKIAKNNIENKILIKNNLISDSKVKEKSRITIPPYSQQFYYSSSPNKLLTNNNNTYNVKAVLEKNLEVIYNSNIETLYKITNYNYLHNSLCVSISTLEIRSPSFFI